MNKQIVVIAIIVSLVGAYLFSMSSVTVLSEFDNIPTSSFITYYADVKKISLPSANIRMELTNNLKAPQLRDGIEIEGHYIDLFVFDDENYDIFKRCGGERGGAEICKDWNPILEKRNLTGTYNKALDPKINKVTVVVWNHDEDEVIQNSISIRLESNYSGIANIMLIFGVLIFYIGMSTNTNKSQQKNVKKKIQKEQ